jgi:hypothetical protein
MAFNNEQREALLRSRLAKLDEERKVIMEELEELQRGAFMHPQHDIEEDLQQENARQKTDAQEKIADFQTRLGVILSLFEALRRELPDNFSAMSKRDLSGFFVHHNEPFEWFAHLKGNLDEFQSSTDVFLKEFSKLRETMFYRGLQEEKDQLQAIWDALAAIEGFDAIRDTIILLERIVNDIRGLPAGFGLERMRQYFPNPN